MKVRMESTAAKFAELCSTSWNGRLARIGIFEKTGGTTTDYWIACGVPLKALSFGDEAGRTVFSMKAGGYSHEIAEPRRVSFHFSPSGEEDGIDVVEAADRTFIVRFEED